MSIQLTIKNILHSPVQLLQATWEKLVLIGFCVVFSIFFINIYTPFGINSWKSDQGILQFIRLSGFGIIGGIFLSISQFVLKPISLKNRNTLGWFTAWTMAEVLGLALVFMLFYRNTDNSLIPEYFLSVKYTFLGLLFPYSFALCFTWIYKKSKEEKPQVKTELPVHHLVGFVDEYGNKKFSLKSSNVLFIEAADNYSTIHYLDNGSVKKEMIRNSLKSLSEQLADLPIKRCHRSYLVNVEKIKIAKKSAGKLSLHLENTESVIPVSRNFAPDFDYLLA
ncbi:LytR/AlgR family response regulator transcription factor [Algoriphagus chordae]|uniref:LytTR family transcriptional regulator n=1 Tax=Algoriphagus chordae TaxID=237019 RepID=A0A2W7QTH2_9BACT|nr:LytTR family DNA-binding domain-containing protein [Algoriphagus chordae]PZX49370.1 LytTR family transcriptional regulator [Algoriphagus chordae]